MFIYCYSSKWGGESYQSYHILFFLIWEAVVFVFCSFYPTSS